MQPPRGGLRDKPGKAADYYHTCYCLRWAPAAASVGSLGYRQQDARLLGHLPAQAVAWRLGKLCCMLVVDRRSSQGQAASVQSSLRLPRCCMCTEICSPLLPTLQRPEQQPALQRHCPGRAAGEHMHWCVEEQCLAGKLWLSRPELCACFAVCNPFHPSTTRYVRTL